MTTTSIEVAPFPVPSEARLVFDIDNYGPEIPISNLDPDALDALAATWLGNIYAAVNRPSPFKFVGDQT